MGPVDHGHLPLLLIDGLLKCFVKQAGNGLRAHEIHIPEFRGQRFFRSSKRLMNRKALEMDSQRLPLPGMIVSLSASTSSSTRGNWSAAPWLQAHFFGAGFVRSGQLPQLRYGDGNFQVVRRCNSMVRFEFHDFGESTRAPDDPAQAQLTIVVDLDRVCVGVAKEENAPVPVRRVIAV